MGNIGGDSLSSMMKNNEGKGASAGAKGGGNIVYRGGSRTPDNLTPRPGRDMVEEKRGLSTFDTLEEATPPGGKAQAIDTSVLKCLGAHCTPDGHVSLRPGARANSRSGPPPRAQALCIPTRRSYSMRLSKPCGGRNDLG